MDVVVVGSVHRDLVLEVMHQPGDGETVIAQRASHVGGGKGANQAVAAARLGAEVAFVGRVGDDPDGDAVRTALAEEGIDVDHLVVDADEATGTAVVMVDRSGENRIVVASGASGRLAIADLGAAATTIGSATVVALQLEVPAATVRAAASLGTGLVQLDPAPASGVDDELLSYVGLLVPNEVELRQLVPDVSEVADGAERLRQRLGRAPHTVVVTLGARGALIVDGDEPRHVPAPEVVVRDTTAAGDAFRGALAGELARGATLDDAVALSARAGAAAAADLGAQPSLPTIAQLPPPPASVGGPDG